MKKGEVGDFIHFPLFEEIIHVCKNKIEDNYPKYRNSWVTKIDDDYWNKRIEGEFSEVVAAYSISERQQELIDLINVAAMALETCEEIK